MIGSVWWARSTVLTAANSDPMGGDGGDEDKLTGLPGILSVCSTTLTEPSRDAKPNDIGPMIWYNTIRYTWRKWPI